MPIDVAPPWLRPGLFVLAAGVILIAACFTACQMYRGDALVCADGAIFAKRCVVNFPADAVLAFEAKKCPKGWRLHAKSAGRFIIGVASDPPAGETRVPLSERAGSQEAEVLVLATASDGPPAVVILGTDPKDRMPPYIALRFCTPGN